MKRTQSLLTFFKKSKQSTDLERTVPSLSNVFQDEDTVASEAKQAASSVEVSSPTKMKLIYVIMYCAILNVLTNADIIEDRKMLDTTNILIEIHIGKGTIWDKIQYFACHDGFSMEQLAFMFAIPDQNFDSNPVKQYALELQLQQKVLKGSDLTEDDVAAQARGNKSIQDLGDKRRKMLDPVLALLIINIMSNPRSHRIDFKYTCRIIGLFWSTRIPASYIKTAIVLDDETCVVRHERVGRKSFKCFGLDIHYVNNIDHTDTGNSIVPDLTIL
ncbi:uncharacterized protein LOC126839696 [Adelges cooleyi]|uniref:uncharacterized protein LOC126839696 n=1 Tax=Adelges cooleyi TaxID=133065 RepID=UPI00217FED11|nr:uncharacterized protein LOC126839696 [Adelges cooleyi]